MGSGRGQKGLRGYRQKGNKERRGRLPLQQQRQGDEDKEKNGNGRASRFVGPRGRGRRGYQGMGGGGLGGWGRHERE